MASTLPIAAADVAPHGVLVTAEEINHEHELARGNAETAVQHAIRCGQLLTAKKTTLAHGEWKDWIAGNCAFSYETAKLYMKAGRESQKGNALPFSSLRSLYGPGQQEAKAARAADIAELSERLENKTPEGQFHVIVLDPPWQYDGGSKSWDPEGFRGVVDYPTMTLEEIAATEIPAADDCVMWLWTTHRFMRHAFPLLDGWGFEEKAILTWVKPRMGIGRWLRSQTEFCVMSVKGTPKVHLTNQTTVLEAPLREHSRKPDEFYAMVDELCIGRKLDYFSREDRPGWAQYGNDTARF